MRFEVWFCISVILVPLGNFSLIWRRHQYRWRAENFLPVLGTHDHWANFMVLLSVSHLLWHGASVYNGHLRGPVTSDTHNYCRVFGSGAITTCFYDSDLLRLGFEHPTFRLKGEHSRPLRPVVVKVKNFKDTEEKKKPLRNKAQCMNLKKKYTFLAIWQLTILLRLRFGPLLSIRKHAF